MVLFDSSVWIDCFNGRSSLEADTLDGLPGQEPVLVGDPMLVEVLQGFRSDRHFRLARDLLLSLDMVNMREAIEPHIELMREDALPIPVPQTRVSCAEVAA